MNKILQSSVLLGSIWMLGMVLSLSTIAIGGRELSASISTLEMVFFRSLFSFVFLIPFVLHRFGGFPGTSMFRRHLVRNLAHYFAQSAWFYGISILPLATVFAIEFSTPVWTLILARLFLGESITSRRLLTVFLGMLGILVVLRPGVIPVQLATLAVLCSAFFFAVSHICTHRLAREESPLHILFFMSLIQVPVSFLPALYNWSTPAGVEWFWLVLLGLASISAHYCVSRALALADASLMIPVDFLRLPLIMVTGFLFYHEILDPYVMFGAAIIFSGNVINLRHEHRIRTVNEQ